MRALLADADVYIQGYRPGAIEGGSYHIDLSLSQTAHYLKGLSRVDPGAASHPENELPDERLAQLLTERDTPYGRLRYLAPVAQLSATPGYWASPTVPFDHDNAEW